jgi:hypothetical protein
MTVLAPDSVSQRSLRAVPATAPSVVMGLLSSPALCAASSPADAMHVGVQEVARRAVRAQSRERKGSDHDDWINTLADSDLVHDAHLLATLVDLDQADHEARGGCFSASVDWMHDAHLLAALSDLEEAVDEARGEGFQPPSDEALRNAGRLLRDMYRMRRCRFEVYPTEDGEVAVSAPGGHGRSVLVLCDSDGGVRCSVNLNGEHRRAVYDPDSAVKLPDGFVREALAALDE